MVQSRWKYANFKNFKYRGISPLKTYYCILHMVEMRSMHFRHAIYHIKSINYNNYY